MRQPNLEDGKGIYDLILQSKPLDVNSRYCYFLLCSHFASTSAVAKIDEHLAAFISAYLIPLDPGVLFVWQVAVAPSLRGRGIAGRMLESILAREVCRSVRSIETTVTPSNTSSRRFFERFARRNDATCTEEPYLTEDLFGEELHEEEILLRIEPRSGNFLN